MPQQQNQTQQRRAGQSGAILPRSLLPCRQAGGRIRPSSLLLPGAKRSVEVVADRLEHAWKQFVDLVEGEPLDVCELVRVADEHVQARDRLARQIDHCPPSLRVDPSTDLEVGSADAEAGLLFHLTDRGVRDRLTGLYLAGDERPRRLAVAPLASQHALRTGHDRGNDWLRLRCGRGHSQVLLASVVLGDLSLDISEAIARLSACRPGGRGDDPGAFPSVHSGHVYAEGPRHVARAHKPLRRSGHGRRSSHESHGLPPLLHESHELPYCPTWHPVQLVHSQQVTAKRPTKQEAPADAGTPAGAAHRNPSEETMQVDRTRMYRVGAVARSLDVSPSTVYRAIESGELAALRIGSSLRVPGEALASWLTTCGLTVKPAAAELVIAGDRSTDIAAVVR
jgi:excisionase family DNA binding protein